ncbi:MAG: hypothetical protein KJZ60_11025, partial [Ignavibacteriaceae bacterium]|nr:hypothetical protein [Ignavibacteriaceae bacterium]
PSHLLIGIHFWFAFLGLMIYVIALSIGGTHQGESWIAQLPFINSVELMVPFWIWRSIGGTFMFLSHIIFAYNLYKMKPQTAEKPAVELAGEQI